MLDLLRSRDVDVEWNTEAVALDTASSADAAVVTLRKNGADEIVRAKYVVGCEGSNSIVRKSLGLAFEGEKYSGEQFIQADCKIAWNLPSGRSYLFLTDDGYMMVIEMPAGMTRIFISLPDKGDRHAAPSDAEQGAVEDMNAPPSLEDIRSNFVRLSGIDATLSDQTWLARYRTSHRYAGAFRKGRCFLAGDAGHVHVPIGGQGMNTGIQDAYHLGWKLGGVATGAYGEALLDTYDAERHPVARSLINGTDRSYRGILDPSQLQQRLVRMFGPFVMKTSIAQNAVASALEELSIGYPDSALNADRGGSAGPKPGEHAPGAATIVRWDDRRTIVFADVMREAEWTLLVFDGVAGQVKSHADAALVPPDERYARIVTAVHVSSRISPVAVDGFTIVIDAEGELHREYGVTEPAYYLIRPDGYVGLRGPGYDARQVAAYLESVAGVARAAISHA